MTSRSTRTRWLASAPGVLLLLSGLSSCVTRPVDSLPPEQSGQVRQTFPARPNDQVDILFVIDDSGSMAQEQENIGRNFITFVQNLRDASGQPFDYRIAVASTDVGVGGVQVDTSDFRLCNNPDRGDPVDQYKGVLQTSIHSSARDWDESNAGLFACGDPSIGLPVGDQGLCDQLRNNRTFLEQSCSGLALTADKPFIENNKTANRSDEDVATQFRCVGSLGVNGCFVEQPLEAARSALAANRAAFIRDTAYLAVVFLTDETECSLADPGLVDPNGGGFRSATDVGFRCYLDAQDCTGEQTNDATGLGGEPVTFTSYTSCTDSTRWLVPVDDYIDFFRNDIKGTGGQDRVITAGILGNPDYTQAPPIDQGGPGAQGADVVFVWESHDAGLAGTVDFQSASCGSSNGSASPARRINKVLDAFPDPMTGAGTFVSICQADFGPALQQLAQRISNVLTTICVDIPADAVAEGVNPNTVCVLDELGPGGETRNGAIASVNGETGAQQWSITANSANCPVDGTGDPALARVEIAVDPVFRSSTFAVDSTIAVTCAQ